MNEDNIGAPRKPEVIERDERVLAAVRAHGSETGVRVRFLREECDVEPLALVHSLNRLKRAGLVSRRNGYRWWPV